MQKMQLVYTLLKLPRNVNILFQSHAAVESQHSFIFVMVDFVGRVRGCLRHEDGQSKQSPISHAIQQKKGLTFFLI